MTCKRLCLIFFLFSIYATCVGQTPFAGVTPGTSTRNDVTKALGQPLSAPSKALFEFAPPTGIAKVEDTVLWITELSGFAA
jgi:hypothetical protein